MITPPVNALQEIHFTLMRYAWGSHADQIISDLLERRPLWVSVVAARLSPLPNDLLPLRDLNFGIWAVDTLYVLVRGDADFKTQARSELAPLAERWGADFAWLDTAANGIEGTETQQALGTGEQIWALARFWWDL